MRMAEWPFTLDDPRHFDILANFDIWYTTLSTGPARRNNPVSSNFSARTSVSTSSGVFAVFYSYSLLSLSACTIQSLSLKLHAHTQRLQLLQDHAIPNLSENSEDSNCEISKKVVSKGGFASREIGRSLSSWRAPIAKPHWNWQQQRPVDRRKYTKVHKISIGSAEYCMHWKTKDDDAQQCLWVERQEGRNRHWP